MSLQCTVLILWFLAPKPLDMSQFLFCGSYSGPYITLHMWVFTLSINISCTELRHRIASQPFTSPTGEQSNSAVLKSWQHQKSICNQLPPFSPPVSHHPLLKNKPIFFPHILVKTHAHTNTHMCSQAEVTSAKAQPGEHIYDWVIHP